MTPTPETTIRVLLKRAAKAPADELPKIIDAITALQLFQARPSENVTALEQRVARLEEAGSLVEGPGPRGTRFR